MESDHRRASKFPVSGFAGLCPRCQAYSPRVLCYPRGTFQHSGLGKAVPDRVKFARGLLIFALGVGAGYLLAAHHFRNAASKASVSQTLGQWQAIFKLPASFRVPLDNPVLAFDFKRDEPELGGTEPNEKLKLTATNLTTRPLTVQMELYGYDLLSLRRSGAIETFPIRPGEKLSRKLTLSSNLGADSLGLPASQAASSFALSVKIQQ